MSNKNEEDFIKNCLQMIEEKLDWGKSQDWNNYDFEKLSVEIEEKTKVILSVTTLKRIWGKVKYPHSPTQTTLNTLAQYLDYADWRAFKQNGHKVEPITNDIEKEETKVVRNRKPYFIVIVLIISSLIILLLSRFYILSTKADESDYQFSANKIISEGVPNSVVFTYDASKAPNDSVYIVQTWDIRRKTLVPKEGKKHSAIYYYPGFFNTKLIVDNTIVKRHDLQITSDGWLCLAEDEPMPIYFKREDYEKQDVTEIDRTTLSKYKLSLLPKSPKIRFFYQKDMGDLMDDNFTFETTLKNEFNEGNNACQYVEVLIQCKNDIIIIPLAAKACVGQMNLYVAGERIESKYADLSNFGCDLNNWVTLKVVTKNKLMKLFVNGTEAYSLTFPNEPKGIVGVQYRFNGIGVVKNTKFSNENGEIKLDNKAIIRQ